GQREDQAGPAGARPDEVGGQQAEQEHQGETCIGGGEQEGGHRAPPAAVPGASAACPPEAASSRGRVSSTRRYAFSTTARGSSDAGAYFANLTRSQEPKNSAVSAIPLAGSLARRSASRISALVRSNVSTPKRTPK